MIRTARNRWDPEPEFRVGTLERAGRQQECATCAHRSLVHHWEDRRETSRGRSSRVAPGGRFWIYEMDPNARPTRSAPTELRCGASSATGRDARRMARDHGSRWTRWKGRAPRVVARTPFRDVASRGPGRCGGWSSLDDCDRCGKWRLTPDRGTVCGSGDLPPMTLIDAIGGTPLLELPRIARGSRDAPAREGST